MKRFAAPLRGEEHLSRDRVAIAIPRHGFEIWMDDPPPEDAFTARADFFEDSC